jgi:NAD(P)-dependent dehydrogenase (short-subunit alcohol dehydrogenase family)
MQAVAAELSRSSTRVDTQQVDVTDRAALIDAITAGTAQLGPIAVLIFNPTGFTPEPAARVNIEALRRDLNVAVLGAVTAVQTALPSLADTARSGSPATILDHRRRRRAISQRRSWDTADNKGCAARADVRAGRRAHSRMQAARVREVRCSASSVRTASSATSLF